MATSKEYAELSMEELQAKNLELSREIFSLRSALASQKLDKPHKIKLAKKDRARVLTVLREKQICKEIMDYVGM